MSRILIFTYNIRRSLFEHGLKAFYSANQLEIKGGPKVVVVPVVNNLGDNIEFRAKEMSKLVENVLGQHEAQSCDLVSFSLSGLDARLGLSLFGMNRYVKSLTTVGTPHQGSKLAWLSQRQILSDKKCEPISRLIGVGLRPFWQVAPQNMKHFNKSIKNVAEAKYFSIGGQRLPNNMNFHLRQTGKYLRDTTQHNFVYENDGVMGHDECLWGQHLVNFEADHSELLGINNFADFPHMLSLIEDTVKSVAKAEM